ncbi:MAG: hypothetical protein F6K42_35500, partial [Leptolyngbya sp. SIO1D8]|nr:hypothetical protein [Leptolyngbya sp. SIO1D8]
VHVYSIGYMAHDPAKPRFMAYPSLFRTTSTMGSSTKVSPLSML